MLELFRAAPEPHLMISLSNVSLQLEFSLIYMGFPVTQLVKNLPATRETWVRSPDWEDPLEKGTASYPLQYSGLENSMDYPLQCSCLENPRDGGAWWAAVYGVAQSWTRLKRLSSSSIQSMVSQSWTGLSNFHIPTISHKAFSVFLP